MPYSKVLTKSGAHFQDWTAIYVRFVCTLLNQATANESVTKQLNVERAPPLYNYQYKNINTSSM
jgi:hypothetical protein